MKLISLARHVRREAELWACDVGYSRDLLMQCGVVSRTFVVLAQLHKHPALMVCGEFERDDGGDEGHWWALAGHRHELLFDLTATQFEGGWPPVVCLGRADPRRLRWQPVGMGLAAMAAFEKHYPVDFAESEELIARVRAKQ